MASDFSHAIDELTKLIKEKYGVKPILIPFDPKEEARKQVMKEFNRDLEELINEEKEN